MQLFSFKVQSYPSTIDESMIATLTAQQDLSAQADVSRVEYFAVPTNGTQPVQVINAENFIQTFFSL